MFLSIPTSYNECITLLLSQFHKKVDTIFGKLNLGAENWIFAGDCSNADVPKAREKKKLKNCLSTKRFVLFELPLDVIVSKSLVTLLITGPRKSLNDEAEL